MLEASELLSQQPTGPSSAELEAPTDTGTLAKIMMIQPCVVHAWTTLSSMPISSRTRIQGSLIMQDLNVLRDTNSNLMHELAVLNAQLDQQEAAFAHTVTPYFLPIPTTLAPSAEPLSVHGSPSLETHPAMSHPAQPGSPIEVTKEALGNSLKIFSKPSNVVGAATAGATLTVMSNLLV